MGTVSAKSSLLSRRYATSLLDMASESGALDAVEKDLNALAAMLTESADLRRVVENPLISRTQQQQALQAIGTQAGFNKLTLQFLGVLSQNRRLPAIMSIINGFNEALATKRGQIKAKVETAFALTPAQEKHLQEQLSKAVNAPVTMEVHVNKELLGGMIVTVGSRQIDDSVKRKLERLKLSLTAQGISNENSNTTPQKEAI